MKKLLISSLFSTLLVGCATIQPYHKIDLNDNAKGIATVRSTPYGCTVLGEAEGKDAINDESKHLDNGELSIERHGSESDIRENAANDLRNNAAEIVGNNKNRIVLRIVEEKALCGYNKHQEEPCNLNDPTHRPLRSLTLMGQVFECGAKSK